MQTIKTSLNVSAMENVDVTTYILHPFAMGFSAMVYLSAGQHSDANIAGTPLS